MAKVVVKESNCCGKRFFDGSMLFKDVVDMVKKIGKVDDIRVSKGTHSYKFSNNIHNIHIHKDGISYDIHLTEKQFKKMTPMFKEMGEIKITEFFWMK